MNYRDFLQRVIYVIINPIIQAMVKVGITPNMVTTIGFVGNLAATSLFVVAALMVRSGDMAQAMEMVGWGGATILFAGLFDMMDGRLARVSGKSSVFGDLWDSTLDRYSEMLQVSKYSIARATKFSDAFVNIDPIMEQNIIFDGYYRSPLGEQFIEVSTSFRMMSMDMLRLYHMLSKVYYYRNATQQQAKLVLLTVQLPESYSPGYASDSPGEATARRLATLQKTFAPAVRNQLLEIIPMEITDDDISRIRKEVEESSAFKTDDPA